MISGSVASFVSRKGPRQFVKFCLVGATSTIIDFGLLNLLKFHLGFPLALAATCSFLVAVCNGFYWNRRWTFRATEGDARRQYPKFVATNVVGWLLNLSIMTLALIVAARLGLTTVDRSPAEIVSLIVTGQGKQQFSPLAVNAAKAMATICVTAWNFTAAKLWTFKT
jgi:putative flippase GtrA